MFSFTFTRDLRRVTTIEEQGDLLINMGCLSYLRILLDPHHTYFYENTGVVFKSR